VDGTEQGNRFGGIYVACQVAKQIGLPEVLGGDRKGRLALLLVLAQLISPMSKRAVVEWAENEAVYEVVGLGNPDGIDFDEDDLYDVLDDLADRRHKIELHLFKLRNKECSRLFLYDVTSSYLEGNCNELAEWGYNRDGKKGKKQIVHLHSGLVSETWSSLVIEAWSRVSPCSRSRKPIFAISLPSPSPKWRS
jgi:transposase